MKKDIISRRQFFRDAAKSALPVLVGMTVLPVFISCEKENLGCEGNCTSTCSSTCSGACTQSCTGSSVGEGCNNGCASDCMSNCGSSCTKGCSSGCTTSCATTCSNNCNESCVNGTNNHSEDSISDASGTIAGYEYVDLGLSVKWARYNVKATQPQQDGYCTVYAFRVLLSEQERIDLLTSLGYYNQTAKREFGGVSEVDMTTYQWGDKWRTPSETEWEELENNCDYEIITYEGVDGVRFTSRINGRSIFIPLSGRRCKDNNYKLEYTGSNVMMQTSTFKTQQFDRPNPVQYTVLLSRKKMSPYTNTYSVTEEKAYLRGVTTGGSNPNGCNNSCVNSASGNSCSSCQTGCSTGCSTGCKSDCSGSCPNGCNTLCGGSCHYSCGGNCSYVSSGSHCTSGTCATTCRNYCYRTCSLACSESCQSCCIMSSK